MDTNTLLQLFTNMDAFLVALASEHGMTIYAVMMLIFYLETGVFLFSFLPGDSLLFVAGTVSAASAVSPWGLMLAVIIGAIAGNTQAYAFGRWFGKRIYTGAVPLLRKEKLARARSFYEKHGGKTVFLGRYIPIIRAFIPIIAGAAGMRSSRFEFFSMTGAVAWAVVMIGAGHLFGNIPFVKNNLSLILLLGVASAFSAPVFLGWVARMLRQRKEKEVVPASVSRE